MADDTTIKPEGPTKTKGPKVLEGPTKFEKPNEHGGLTDLGGSTKTRREELFRSEERTYPEWFFPIGSTKSQREELFRSPATGSLKSEEPSTLQKGSTKTRREELFRSPVTGSLKIEEPSTEFKKVLYQTRVLHIVDHEYSYEHQWREAQTIRSKDTEGMKSGHTIIKGENIELLVNWKTLDYETQLTIDDLEFFHGDFPEFISILCPMCPVVRHVSFSFLAYMYNPFVHREYMGQPSTEGGMKSVRTVCIKMKRRSSLSDVLWFVGGYFPNAENLDVQEMVLYVDSPDVISSSEVNHLSVLKKLKLTANEIRDNGEAAYLFFCISKTCPNITSLIIAGITSLPFNWSTQELPCNLAQLTNIQLGPCLNDFYPFETLTNVLKFTSVEIPQLELLEANKVSLELGTNVPLASVTWSRISSGCELKLKDASATVPLVDLIQLVSNELKGVTSLRLERCNVMLPEKIYHPKQKLGEGSLLRELKLFRKKNLRKADLQKLSEMYPDVKVRVFDGSNISHDVAIEQRPQPDPEDSQLGKEKTAISERRTSSSSLSLLGDEMTVSPIRKECCQKVGVEGGKLQLETFGIELDIPPGAIGTETPQEISLRVLTDTPNLVNSEEFSVCFGVQCLAPDDLVLKCPVTYTIPHCAAFSRISSADAVLYTGEGEYTPNAVVKQRIQLESSGIPCCTITKDVFKLKMNHFSWAKVKLWVKNLFFRGKRMCCQPYAEKTLPEQRNQVILRTYLYDDIPGNREIIEKDEEKQDFKPVHPQIQIPIKTGVVDLRMTCYVQKEVIGEPAVVNFDKLISGTIICEPFTLDFSNQPYVVVVSLIAGQTKKHKVNLTFPLKFPTVQSCKIWDQEMEGASPSQATKTRKSKDERSLNPSANKKAKLSVSMISAGQKDFDGMLKIVAEKVRQDEEIDELGKALGFDPADIHGFIATNKMGPNVSHMGTLEMLRKWRKKQTKHTERPALLDALEEAGQIHLADELFGSRSGN